MSGSIKQSQKLFLCLGFIVVSMTLGMLWLTGCTQSNVQSQASQHQTQGLLYCAFDVSPDGKTIVFSGIGNGGKDLYLLDLTTNKVTRLTNTPDYENFPAFSPDGKTIVYQSAKSLDQPRHLFLRSLDGKHVRQLTSGTPTSDSSPSFSRDGEKIVFCRSQTFFGDARGENTWDNQDVYIVNRSGSGLQRLTQNNYRGMIKPRFYPDGKDVLFDAVEVGPGDWLGPGDVYGSLAKVSTSRSKKVEQILRLGTFDSSPSFFPDGSHIVFSINSDGTLVLYQATLHGGVPSQIIPHQSWSGFTLPVITADGKKIYCVKAYGMSLWEINTDGSGLRQIADNTLFSDPMHWNPTAK